MKSLVLFATLIIGIATSCKTSSSSNLKESQKKCPSLIRKDNFKLGNIDHQTDILNDFSKHWNLLTIERRSHWKLVQPKRGVKPDFDSLEATKVYQYTEDQNLFFKGHALLWELFQPEWMADLPPEEQRKEVKQWIQSYCSAFPQMALVDVINEPFIRRRAADGSWQIRFPSYKGAMTDDESRNLNLGSDYEWIYWGFKQARKLCPGKKLILNSYRILDKTPSQIKNDKGSSYGKFDRAVEILAEHKLIDGVGIQFHNFDVVKHSFNTIRNGALAEGGISRHGIPIHISELSIGSKNFDEKAKKNGWDGKDASDQQLTTMKKLFTFFRNHPLVESVTLWGNAEGRMWRMIDGANLFEKSGEPRPAMKWIDQCISQNLKNSENRDLKFSNK